MSQPSPHEVVRFNGAGASIAGSLSGVAIALGVPYILLTHGEVLGRSTQLVLVWVGVLLGGVLSLTSAFFGLVMPTQVGGPNGNPWGGNPWEHGAPDDRAKPSSSPSAAER